MENLNTIFFVCMSKNCFKNLKKNLDYLIQFKKFTKFKVKLLVVDSDSNDNTKEYCSSLEKMSRIDKLVEIDNLEKFYSSRIERLTICRNAGLDEIKQYNLNNIIYVPIDSDIDIFQNTNFPDFEKIIDNIIESENIDGVFPFSTPYYYDIFALRKSGWVKNNSLLKARQLKNKIKIGSFIINYFYIFKKQVNKTHFKQDAIKVTSAFGGIGVYKIDNLNTLTSRYLPDFQNIDMVSEHINFNDNFSNLYILRNWNIPAPLGYVHYNISNLKNKFTYILKSIKNDFNNL